MLIVMDEAHRDSLPVYEVKELSVEEAMWAIARDRMPENLGLPRDYPATAFTPAFKTLTA